MKLSKPIMVFACHRILFILLATRFYRCNDSRSVVSIGRKITLIVSKVALFFIYTCPLIFM